MTCKRPWFVWCINVNNWLCCNDCVKFNDASVCNVRKLHFQVSFCRQHEVKRQYWFYCSRSFDQLLWTRCLSAPTQLGGADKHLFEANLSFLPKNQTTCFVFFSVGKYQTQVVTQCREAIKASHVTALFKIIQAGSAWAETTVSRAIDCHSQCRTTSQDLTTAMKGCARDGPVDERCFSYFIYASDFYFCTRPLSARPLYA